MPIKNLSRAAAIANGEIHYFTGQPCKRGHIAKRTVKDHACTECSLFISKKWRKERKDDPKYRARFAAYAAQDRARHPEKYRERMAKFVASRTEEYWLTKRASVYGLSLADYMTMYAAQDGKCWICSKPCEHRGKAHICIDHCHKTKMVRGLLCPTCNKSVGAFKDSPELLRRAADYLEKGSHVGKSLSECHGKGQAAQA